ncbi:MAG: Yip1 family protein [Tranquillimonas sp.]
MSFDLPTLVPLALRTLRAPQGEARRLMALDLPRDVLWQSLLLVVALSVILAELSDYALRLVYGDQIGGGILAGPFVLAGLQLTLLIVMVHAIYWLGRAAGGEGRFEDAILVVVWLQFILVCLQAVQTVALVVLPPLAWLIGVLGLVLFMWLLTHFIAAVHGFRSLGRIFAGILAAMLAVAMILSLLLSMAGLPMPEVSNV